MVTPALFLSPADPFAMHRGDTLPDLSFPADMKNVPLFTDHVDASRDIYGELLPAFGPDRWRLVFPLTFAY